MIYRALSWNQRDIESEASNIQNVYVPSLPRRLSTHQLGRSSPTTLLATWKDQQTDRPTNHPSSGLDDFGFFLKAIQSHVKKKLPNVVGRMFSTLQMLSFSVLFWCSLRQRRTNDFRGPSAIKRNKWVQPMFCMQAACGWFWIWVSNIFLSCTLRQ